MTIPIPKRPKDLENYHDTTRSCWVPNCKRYQFNSVFCQGHWKQIPAITRYRIQRSGRDKKQRLAAYREAIEAIETTVTVLGRSGAEVQAARA